MGVQSEVQLDCVNRLEVLAGPTGRRKWPDAVKGRLVAESFVPGVSVREVAERHGLMPNHLSTWRRLAKQGKLVVPDLAGADVAPDFACVVLDNVAPATGCLERIEVETGGVTLRLDVNTSVLRIAELVSALKAYL